MLPKTDPVSSRAIQEVYNAQPAPLVFRAVFVSALNVIG